MSKLAADAAAFKNVLQRQDYTSWHSNPGASSTPAASEQPAASKKKRPKANIVYSQPADTGTGVHVNTQLVYAVNHLKGTPNPMRLQDLAIITNTPLDTDRVLLEKFKAHDKIAWDPRTDLYSYKHEFNFKNKASLLTEIQRRTRKGGGIAVRDLKETWKEAPAAVEELEKEGEVLVTRTAKDGQLKMVFWNELKPDEESGGKNVEKEFMDLWHELNVPDDVDLLRQLATEGLQVTASHAAPPKAPGGKKKGKKGGASRQRQVRITNTHLKGEIDLSRDFVVPGK
ncbi:transcription initiation factor IIE subunit beta [Mucidula mucida]|nr:transcription initiation factor IIE subunit beta [Mucidula mucida]KAF8903019.1 transcription initiation factor IIE subunit beta [Mucidula mucida]